jgi:hypothetical protein
MTKGTVIRIPLPDMRRSQNANAHPYPFQIGMQTLEFMQGSLFHASVLDIAAGTYIRQPDAMENLRRIFMEKLDSPKTWDDVWETLGKYQAVFERAPMQSVLIAMNSHWDWYSRKLIDFISFARQELNQPMLEKRESKRLGRFSSLPIIEQLEVIQIAAEIKITLNEEDKSGLQEMSLVRNLGLHNRWEIDKRYLERTVRSGYQLGELRIIELEELNRWHQAFIKVINAVSAEVVLAFVMANDYS